MKNSVRNESRFQAKSSATFSRDPKTVHNIVKVHLPNPKQKALSEGNSAKCAKEIQEWLEDGEYEGIEILEAVANSPSEFGYLIERAVKDISIAIDKQRLKLIGQIDEYAENSHERELDIEKYTERVEKLKKQNEKLKSSLEHQTYYYDALEGDLKRIQDIAQKPHETTVIENPAIASKSFVDDLTLPLDQRIEMYTLEKNRLEAQLEMLTNTFQRLDQIKDECIFQLNK